MQKFNKLKQTLLLIGFLLPIVWCGARASAQQMDLIPFHYAGSNRCVDKVLQRPDGDIVSMLSYITDDVPPVFLGNVFYRVSPTSVSITDTLFVPGGDENYCIVFEKDPDGEGYVKVEMERMEDGGFNVHIFRFSGDGFPVNPSEEVVVPVCDWHDCYVNECMIDCRGDIIVRYDIPLHEFADTLFDFRVARFGLDGTLKHDALLAQASGPEIFGQLTGFNSTGFGVLSEHPLKYYYSYVQGNLFLNVYDSLFQQENY